MGGGKIEGRNLLLSTKDFSQPWNGTATIEKDSDGFSFAEIIGTWEHYVYQDIGPETKTGTYTLSFLARTDDEKGATFEVKNDNTENNYAFGYAYINNTEWQKYKVTCNIPHTANTHRISFLTRQNEVAIYVKCIKFEYGLAVNPIWTPALEDIVMQNDFNALVARVAALEAKNQ